MKVLIAEDDVILCNDLEKHLKERGYDGVTAEEGNEAWEFAQSTAFRLAILYRNMPRLDGMELSQRIRCEDQREDSIYSYISAKNKGRDRIILVGSI
jgi:DNA-binding response OmpR family regulator